MTYSPVLPVSGYSGWLFLKRTMAQQTAAFAGQQSIKRDEAYFRERIGSIATAEDLVKDSRLLRVALAAYGLESDLPNKFFIRKILEDGTLKTDSLANKLADKRYKDFSNAFGFGNFTVPRTRLSDFADKMLDRYREQKFQEAVGEQNGDLRLALNAENELFDLAASPGSELSKWYSILGSPPLRQVVVTAFGLPSGFASVDLDKQIETLQARARATFGETSVSQFGEPEAMEKLVRLFIVRSEISDASLAYSGGQVALTLLQQMPVPRYQRG